MADSEHLNPNLFGSKSWHRPKKLGSEELLAGIIAGDRAALSKGITLVESSLESDHLRASELIKSALKNVKPSIRLGISGLPGAGKSSLIEVLGLKLIEKGLKVAVLAVDPSSTISKGSILGDKTRMEQLSNKANAFIRPSPSGSMLGGANRASKESIILCEAAGFDVIILETVGVGQSESAVRDLCDFFLLLLLTGAGDELQGIKRGVMELADCILIHKADGENLEKAKRTKAELSRALHFYPNRKNHLGTKVLTGSSLADDGIDELWQEVLDFQQHHLKSGFWEEQRKEQDLKWFQNSLNMGLIQRISQREDLVKLKLELKQKLSSGDLDSFQAADIFLDQALK